MGQGEKEERDNNNKSKSGINDDKRSLLRFTCDSFKIFLNTDVVNRSLSTKTTLLPKEAMRPKAPTDEVGKLGSKRNISWPMINGVPKKSYGREGNAESDSTAQ